MCTRKKMRKSEGVSERLKESKGELKSPSEFVNKPVSLDRCISEPERLGECALAPAPHFPVLPTSEVGVLGASIFPIYTKTTKAVKLKLS